MAKVEDSILQLQRTGELSYRQPAGKVLGLLVIALVFGLFGLVGIIVFFRDHGVRALLNFAFWICTVAFGFFGVLGVPALLIQLLRPFRIHLTHRGVARQQLIKGHWVDQWGFAWGDIEAIDFHRTRRLRLIMLQVTPEAHDALLGDSRVARGIAKIEAPLSGGAHRVPIEGSHTWRIKRMFEVMERAHQLYAGRAEPGRYVAG